MQSGARPEFLQKAVAYCVAGAERWRYADTLEALTSRSEAFNLQSAGEQLVYHSESFAADLEISGFFPTHGVAVNRST